MIKKFVKICGVGKFSDFCACGEGLTFNKVNIIYGENSAGKTTMTSIIKSLHKNNAELMTNRKSIGSEGEQYCEILSYDDQRQQTCKFENNTWSGCISDVEVFDTYFVNENVYTGLTISSEQQRGLYQFALGEESVDIVQEIETIKKNLERKHEQQRSTSQKLELIAENVFTPQDFTDLPQDEEINSKIAHKEHEIKTAQAKQQISAKGKLTSCASVALSIDLARLAALLKASIEDISQECLQIVETHKQKLSPVMKEETEQWLQRGISYIQDTGDTNCPFCQQEIKSVLDIIEAYKKYFDNKYLELKENMDIYLEDISCWNLENQINKAMKMVLQNNVLIEFWRTYLPKLTEPKVELEQLSANIKEVFSDLKKIVECKKRNVLEKIDTNIPAKLRQYITELKTILENYNSEIQAWNIEIERLKKEQPDVERLNSELKRLKVQKKRYSDEVNALCEDYRSLWQMIEEDKKKIEKKENQLKELVVEKAVKYGNEINSHLDKFGVCFRINDARTIYKGRGREPYLDYAVHISDYLVDLENQLPYCMGEGDKNTLAFAFFLAKLTLDEHVDSKIIVFDDPVSSLDRNRRRRSVEYMRDLAQKAQQVIVLTHNDIFAFDLYETLKDIGVRPATLQISNGALAPWDIEDAMKHRFFVNVSRLESFVDGVTTITATEARSLVRIVLEDALKFRYFKYFESLGDNCWLGPMIGKLREAVANSAVVFRATDAQSVLTELSNLCDFSGPEHHGAVERPHQQDISLAETKTYAELTLRLIFEWL